MSSPATSSDAVRYIEQMADEVKRGLGRASLHYLVRGGQELEETVLCKLCGVKIRGLVEDEKFERTERKNDKTIVYKKLVYTPLSNYREIRILMKDGSSHVTNLCSACVNELDIDRLLVVYIMDLDQMLFDDRHSRPRAPMSFWERVAYRKPVSWEFEDV